MLCVAPHAPTAGRWELTEEQWAVVEPVLRGARRADNRGRPWHDTRSVLNGVFWVLGTGAQWRALPEKYPPYQTCHSRFQQWIRSRQLEEALKLLAIAVRTRQTESGGGVRGCNLRERQKRRFAVGPTRRGKGTKIIAIAAGNNLPLAIFVQSLTNCRPPARR